MANELNQMNMNGLLPQANGPQQQNQSASPIDHSSMLDKMHDQAKAQYEATQKPAKMIEAVRRSLADLQSKGEAVSQDDVLEHMASLVANSGASPKSMVMLMAGNPAQGQPPMPDSGPALAQWIAQQEQRVTQAEQQLKPQQDLARHQLGVAAIHSLVGDHINQSRASSLPPRTPATPISPNPPTLQ
jgi:hypothetical protein